MKTAETIIREYLERGYSLESLRVLVKHRSEPLRSEMMEVLNAMEGCPAPEIPCGPASEREEEPVFCVADETQVDVEEIHVDFDMLSESGPRTSGDEPPAGLEESVAEIAVDETEGSPFIPVVASGSRPQLPAGNATGQKESRKEKRMRERAEKKKRKLEAKQEAAARESGLPEIVLTRSRNANAAASEDGRDGAVSEYAAEESDRPAPSLLPAARAVPADSLALATGDGPDERSGARAMTRDEAVDSGADDYEPAGDEADAGGNVILFPAGRAYDEIEDDADGEGFFALAPTLRMLPPLADGESAEAAANDEEREAAAAGVPAFAEPEPAEEESAPSPEEAGHSGAAENASAETEGSNNNRMGANAADLPGKAEGAGGNPESVYQERLDELASRILEIQTVAAAREALLNERAEDIRRRDDELAALRSQRDAEGAKNAELARALATAREETALGQSKLDGYKDILKEHERLYNEFEDLRKAYNEVVVEVMPALQSERDDLAVTVERQCEAENRMRVSLASARRRLAVGYSLGAAACLMLVALPVFNWLRSGDDSRDLALDRQKVSDLQVRMEKAETLNVRYENDLLELERKSKLQLDDLERRNSDLAHLAEQRLVELANAKTGRSAVNNGAQTRVSAMIGPTAQANNGRLAVNEVRDPAGQIDKTVAANRARYSAPSSRSDSAPGNRIQVSAVASAGASKLRPPAGGSRTAAGAGNEVETASSAQKQRETLAKVKAGEGVAQVVYRILGTRDPEVIAWVIRENNIKNDRRGNPRIYPDQELRLPRNGRTGQTASAAKR